MTATTATIDLTSEPTVRVRAVVAYDGAGFHGFATHPAVRTVGGTIAATLAKVWRVPAMEITCAGRTDAGVHGWGQVISFDLPVSALERKDLPKVQRAVNKLLEQEIVVRSVELADPMFDARHAARARRYRYTIVNRPWPDPFLARTAWHVPEPLDLRAMRHGCLPFIGAHDFTSFCRRPKRDLRPGETEISLTRRVRSLEWEEAGDGILHLWIEANAFCHQMVRSITGTLVEVGRGRLRAGDMRSMLAARDRHVVAVLAPPQGLCLWSVDY